MIDSPEYDEVITVRVPRGTSLAFERAAIRLHTRPGQMARLLLLEALRLSGFDLGQGAILRQGETWLTL